MDTKLKVVLEAPVATLRDLLTSAELAPVEHFYASMLMAYLSGDAPQLKNILSVLDGDDNFPKQDKTILSVLGEARLKLRCLTLSPSDGEKLLTRAANFPEPWRSEASFIAAMLEEALKNENVAAKLYLSACKGFQKCGMQKKSIKALQNHVAAESRLHKNRPFLIEYNHLYRRALKCGEKQVAGVALNNLSREYQKLGALKSALKFSTKAIALLREDFGSLHFEQALAHRAHLLLMMDRGWEADAVLEQISYSKFPEIQAAYAIIEGLIAGEKSNNTDLAVYKTWKDREKDGKIMAKHRLPELEERLLALVSVAPQSKHDLIRSLYGDKIDAHAADNRLKNLLNRVRKKFPKLIVYQDGYYAMADSSYFPSPMKKGA